MWRRKDQFLLLQFCLNIQLHRTLGLQWNNRRVKLTLPLCLFLSFLLADRVTTSTQIILIRTCLMHSKRDWRNPERETCQTLCFCLKQLSYRTLTIQRWILLIYTCTELSTHTVYPVKSVAELFIFTDICTFLEYKWPIKLQPYAG